LPSTLSGRVTAQLEMALPGMFQAERNEFFGQEGFSQKTAKKGYEIIVDTREMLLWKDDADAAKPHLIITSEQVLKEYLNDLDKSTSLGLPWARKN